MFQMWGVVKKWECRRERVGGADLRVEAYGTKHSSKKKEKKMPFFFWLLCICMHTQTTLQYVKLLRK